MELKEVRKLLSKPMNLTYEMLIQWNGMVLLVPIPVGRPQLSLATVSNAFNLVEVTEFSLWLTVDDKPP
jgi:hypothetical protein